MLYRLDYAGTNLPHWHGKFRNRDTVRRILSDFDYGGDLKVTATFLRSKELLRDYVAAMITDLYFSFLSRTSSCNLSVHSVNLSEGC